MSTRRPTGSPGPGEPDEFARAEAVAALAREVDRLHRDVVGMRGELDALAGVSSRVDDLARAVAQLADAVAETAGASARPSPAPAPSWVSAPGDAEVTGRMLDELVAWLHGVFLRYPDGAMALPECWLWHPDVIEELTWLMHAWLSAYQGRGASVQAAGDWHDRLRSGVVRRIRALHGSCSIETHQRRPGWTTGPTPAVPVPGVDALLSIAQWWAVARDLPAPEPAPRPTNHHGGRP